MKDSKGDISPSKGDDKRQKCPQKVIISPQKVIIHHISDWITEQFSDGKHFKICFKRIKTTTVVAMPSKSDNRKAFANANNCFSPCGACC